MSTFIKLWDGPAEECVDIDPKHLVDLAASKKRWLQNGEDILLQLKTAEGAEYFTCISAVRCWLLSTPETREVYRERAYAMDEEKKAFLAQHGEWE